MAKVQLLLPPGERTSRAPRQSVARLTIYKDGIGKLTAKAMDILGNPEQIAMLHDTEDSNVIYISSNGNNTHKISKQGSFSAAPLHKHVGSPTRPMRIDLYKDADGDLRGDTALASWGENRAPRATVNGSDAEVASNGASSPTLASSVEGTSSHGAKSHSLPDASAPSDTSDDDEDEDDDLYADDEEDD